MEILIVLLVLAAGALGLYATGTLGGKAAPDPPAGPPPAPAPEPVDLSRTVDGQPELQALYARIGFPPDVERSCARILAEIEGQIRAEIPDFVAFRAALAEAERSLETDAGGFPEEDVALLREAARATEESEVLRLLDRQPVRRLLPVLEQILLVRGGEKVLRTPVALTLLRKRPADPERCERLLEELEGIARNARLPRPERLRDELLEAIVRVRRDARRETAFMPTSLRILEAAVEAWLTGAAPAVRRRREELDALLLGMLQLRRSPGEDPREAARAQAKRYADSPWMHTPWLTAYALTNLLDAELAALPEEERRQPSPRAAVLRWVRDEVASSHFDSEETIRRLRQQEQQELYVHSLVYGLLRLGRPASGGD